MWKYCLLFVLLAVAAAEKGQNNSDTENFIRENKNKHDHNIEQMGWKIVLLNKTSFSVLQTIDYEQDKLVNLLDQTNKRFDRLQILNNVSKECVAEYRKGVPSVANTTEQLQSCKNVAEAQLPDVFLALIETKNQLIQYYEGYDAAVENCTSSQTSGDFSVCVQKAALEANGHTKRIQKTFGTQFETVRVTVDVLVKDALECSYTTETKVITAIADANNLIAKCRL